MRFATMVLALAACTGDEVIDETPVSFSIRLTNISAPGDLNGADHLFAPGIAVLHAEGWALFADGDVAGDRVGLEALAEDGDNSALLDAIADEVDEAVSFAAQDAVTYADAPMLAGDEAAVTFEATPGARLTIAIMYGESNDIFAALPSGGIALFDGDAPVSGDVSGSLDLYDAGTELNQEPGAGADQPMRQAAPNTGEDEDGLVRPVFGTDDQGFTYPPVGAMLKLEITPST